MYLISRCEIEHYEYKSYEEFMEHEKKMKADGWKIVEWSEYLFKDGEISPLFLKNRQDTIGYVKYMRRI